jgi:amino acid transporter
VGAFVSMFACVLACTTAAARVLLRMAHVGLLPDFLEKTDRRHGTPSAAVAVSAGCMFAATAALALGGVQGSDMYDWIGSLSVFGFLTAYALVAAALPFARRAAGQHSRWVLAVSVVTVVVMILIVIFDLRSAMDATQSLDLYGLYRAGAGLVFYAPGQDDGARMNRPFQNRDLAAGSGGSMAITRTAVEISPAFCTSGPRK